mmetsp:Transcript_15597/g.33806  ORF Transcript_15597/g.33806 Transcript_15597/m.33806 type:complete len:484 (+) Transcript_15597:610-2061(+)
MLSRPLKFAKVMPLAIRHAVATSAVREDGGLALLLEGVNLLPGGLVAGELRWHRLVGVGEELLEVEEHPGVVVREEGGGRPLLTRAPCATNAMRVLRYVRRHCVVEHMRDVWDVDTTASNICSDQHLVRAVFEALQARLALVLRLAAVQHRGRLPHGAEQLVDVVALLLGVHKHDHRLSLRLPPHEVLQHLRLLVLLAHEHVLGDEVRCLARIADVDHSRVAHVLPREPLHGGRHGGAEHVGGAVHLVGVQCGVLLHGLEVGRGHRVQHAHHLGLEAHVDHAVCLVQHHVVALVEHGVAALEAIQQAPGGRDDNLAPAAQLEALLLDALPAHHAHHPVVHVVRELDRLLLDLLSQLTGGGHDEGVGPLRLVGLVQRRLLADVRQHRHHERARLARARLGDADDVAAGEADGDGGHLDGRRLGVANLLDRLEEALGEVRLLPIADGQRQAPPLERDVEVLLEDAPVALRHVLLVLLRPVHVQLL